MTKNRTLALLTLLLAALLFAACSPAGNAPSAYVALPAQDQADARATIAAADIAIKATAEVEMQQTAVAVDATRKAIAEQTAVAQEATRVAVATREAMQGQQTAVALQMAVDEATRVAQAEQTAVAVTIAAEIGREQQRADNVVMMRAAEASRLQTNLFWRQVFNGLMAGLLLAAIVGIFLIAGSVVARVRSLNSNPVRQYSDGVSNVNILVVPNGLFGTEVRQIGRPSTVVPQLPPPTIPQLPPPVRELPPITEGHVLFAGPSGAGKSTAMRAILQHRQNVTVLDPHAAPGEWNAARVIGMEGNFNEIAEFFGWMDAELDRRMGLRGRGEQLVFEPVTVATDEMPAIAERLGRNEANRSWVSWVRQGRKFGLFVMISTQSTRVKTLGIAGEGDLVRQFQAVVNLGSEAVSKFPDLLQDAPVGTAVIELAGQQPRVIRIPHVPAFSGANGAAADFFRPRPPMVVEQPANGTHGRDPAAQGLDTEYGFVPAHEVAEILGYGRNMSSLRGVAYNVYGSTGGAGFYKTRAVLEQLGVTLQAS
jgi:hypothetical protein